MTRPIYARPLLRTARELAGHNAAAGRPALTDLRRATSTANYAVFHQITRHGALQFLPVAADHEVADLARWFTHTGILKAANLVTTAAGPKRTSQIGKEDRSAVAALRASGGSHGLPHQLVLLADSFATLQDARHKADYDSNYDPYRSVTLSHVAQAEEACEAAWWLWRSRELNQGKRVAAAHSYNCFLMLANLKSGGPKTR